jgi:hypothetical protein
MPARSWPPLVPALVAGILLAFALREGGPIVARDLEQERASLGIAGRVLVQEFTPAHDGLSALELMPQGDSAALVMTLRAGDQVLATAEARDVRSGVPVRFEFRPLSATAGRRLAAEVSAPDGGLVALRAWEHDGHPGGSVAADGRAEPGDLWFRTDYTLSLAAALGGVLAAARDAGALLVLGALLFLPGLVLRDLAARLAARLERGAPLDATGANVAGAAGPERTDGAGWWRELGLALGLSLAFWPLAWLLAPWPWTPATLALCSAALALYAALAIAPRVWRARGRLDVLDAALLAVLVLVAATRVLAVRDVALPLWVDSSRHALITRLFVEAGHVPRDYRPLVDVPRFFYHFGFHALAGSFALLAGRTVDQALLIAGQALNALAALAVGVLAAWAAGSRRAGVVAAVAVGLVALYPAYFVSWGRYTQLGGLVLLPAAMIVAAELLGWRAQSRAERRAGAVLFGLLGAGLFLTHYRVFAFWLVWLLVAALIGLVRLWRASGRAAARDRLVPAAGGLALAGLLCLPWFVRVARDTLPAVSLSGVLSSPGGYNAFPDDYFNRGYERLWLVSGFVVALALLLLGRRRTLARHWPVLAVAGWAGLVLVLLNLERIGGPSTWMVNNQSWAIALFVPAGVLAGWSLAGPGLQLAEVLRGERLEPLRANLGFVVRWLLTALIGYLLVFGTWQAITIVNPTTILATPADREALLWAAEHTPADAVFLVNGRFWQTDTWIVPDGGAWLAPLAFRRATLPPIDYGFDRALRDEVNARAARLAQPGDLAAPELRAELDALGVRYAYVGTREGALSAGTFLASPDWRVAFTNGSAWVFERVR